MLYGSKLPNYSIFNRYQTQKKSNKSLFKQGSTSAEVPYENSRINYKSLQYDNNLHKLKQKYDYDRHFLHQKQYQQQNNKVKHFELNPQDKKQQIKKIYLPHNNRKVYHKKINNVKYISKQVQTIEEYEHANYLPINYSINSKSKAKINSVNKQIFNKNVRSNRGNKNSFKEVNNVNKQIQNSIEVKNNAYNKNRQIFHQTKDNFQFKKQLSNKKSYQYDHSDQTIFHHISIKNNINSLQHSHQKYQDQSFDLPFGKFSLNNNQQQLFGNKNIHIAQFNKSNTLQLNNPLEKQRKFTICQQRNLKINQKLRKNQKETITQFMNDNNLLNSHKDTQFSSIDAYSDHELNMFATKYKPISNLFKQISLSNFKIKKYRNGVYFGQLNKDQQKSGKGIIFYYNGRVFEGQFINDQKNGYGIQIYPDCSKYQGQYINGFKQGKGRFQWANGQIYDGQWQKGKRNGSGMWKSNKNQSYIGQWINGKVQGFGVLVTQEGNRYEGQFINSLKYGQGTQRYINGDTYVGTFRKNIPNGKGQYFWRDGSYYKGQFSNGVRHGGGFYKYKSSNTYEGGYRNDKKCGYGQYNDADNNQKYVGNWQNNLKHGYGELIDLNTNYLIFKGFWVNNERIQQEQQQRQSEITIIDQQAEKQGIKNKVSKLSHYQKRQFSLKKKNIKSQAKYWKPCGCIKQH